MIELDNITLREYFELEDKTEYDFGIKYGFIFTQGKDFFNVGDFTNLTFKQVKDMQDYCQQGITWMQILDFVSEVKKIDVKEIARNKLVDICNFKSYIVSEIERINEIESIALGHTSSDDELEAGVKELSELGVFWQYDELTGGDITKKESVEKLPYSLCFLKLVANKRKSEFENKLFKIKNKIR